MPRQVLALLIAVLLAPMTPAAHAAPAFHLWTIGNETDVQTNPQGGVALMGGGQDVDAAFRWLIDRGDGGDMVVIRASGDDAYNPYLANLPGVAKPVDSVTTILFSRRSAASEPAVLQTVANAEALFIAGGDQAAYLQLWKDTPLEEVIAERIAAGTVIGGTSAGAVILGQHIYSAQRGTVTSRTALRDPFDRRMTLTTGFLSLSSLNQTIVDSHVGERNRDGRLVAFLARIAKTHGAPVRGIGIDEATALLIDANGTAIVAGEGQVVMIQASRPAERCKRQKPLTYLALNGIRADAGDSFNLPLLNGVGVEAMMISVTRGRLRETPTS